jgi:catechol 2,3-dioxygenase-like lactoylglutathione lyase family enzyme
MPSIRGMNILKILETCLYAEDLEQAEEFYTRVLGLQLFARERGRHLFFKCGNQMLLIFEPSKTIKETEIAPHGALGPGHVAFAVPDSELDVWAVRLRDHGVGIEKILSWPKGGRSIYFRDPAGNCLELASPRIWGIEEAS